MKTTLQSVCLVLLASVACGPLERVLDTAQRGIEQPAHVNDAPQHCDAAALTAAPSTIEQAVHDLVNEARSKGADCRTAGVFAATGPLTLDPRLGCAARGHATDMRQNNYFDHTSQDGRTMAQRITQAGVQWTRAGENIAQGQPTAAEVVRAWLLSDGHCANLMGDFKLDGVGYDGAYWVHDFATE